MKKQLLALAVAGALAPAAAMAQSTVEIYGRGNLSLNLWEADGATLGPTQDFDRRWRVTDSGSRLGFRVNEALGGGLRAFVVIETGVNIDTGDNTGESGSTNVSTGFWASRDSYVGLGGGWGDVRLGRQSIWWSNGVIAQTGANYINSAVDGLINDPGLVAIPTARTSNTISYNSPTFGGFNASVSYSTNPSEATVAGVEANGRIVGITGRYTSGALRAQADWAQFQANTPAAPAIRPERTGWKVGLGWAYAPGSQISGIFGRLENEGVGAQSIGGVLVTPVSGTLEQDFWLLNWEHLLGQWQLLAQYYQNDEVEGLDVGGADTSARGITLAAKYFLSKRTGVYASYSQVKNDRLSFADMSGGGFSSVPGGGGLTAASAGADVSVFGVGIMHNF